MFFCLQLAMIRACIQAHTTPDDKSSTDELVATPNFFTILRNVCNNITDDAVRRTVWGMVRGTIVA